MNGTQKIQANRQKYALIRNARVLIGIVRDRVNVLTSMQAMDSTAQSSHLVVPVRIHLEQSVGPKRMRMVLRYHSEASVSAKYRCFG